MGTSYSTPTPPPAAPPAKPKQIIRVCGVGDPVTDILVKVDPSLLTSLGVKPGSCTLVKQPSDVDALLKVCQDRGSGRLDMRSVAGGSAANVMKGIAALGRGIVTVELVGSLGRDKTGQEYKQLMNLAGVGTSAVALSDKGSPSAQAVCLITPDGQRTMRVSLGAAADTDERVIKQPEAAALLTTSQLLHVEGYALRRPGAVRAAVSATSASGGVVSLDLASTDIVSSCFPTLLEVLRLNVVDLVFGNEAELEALGAAESLAAGRIVPEGAAAREAGVDFLLQFVQVVTVTLGADGSLTVRRDKERFVTPALEVPVEDTTGAGDLFTAGFLWALLHGAPLPICAAQGSAMAAEIVQVVGTTLDDASWRRLREGSYGYQPPQAQASAPAALASAPSIGTLIGLDRSDYGPPKPHLVGSGSTATLPEGPGSRSVGNGVWRALRPPHPSQPAGVGDEAYEQEPEKDQHLKPSEYGYNSAGDIVKIRRTMSGRIYGAVFERLEKIPPPVGGALHRRASSKMLDPDNPGGMERSESSSTVAALEASGGPAGGCGMPADYGGYSTYFGYLVAWGLGWVEDTEAPNAETASIRMRRSMSSRVMQQSVIESGGR